MLASDRSPPRRETKGDPAAPPDASPRPWDHTPPPPPTVKGSTPSQTEEKQAGFLARRKTIDFAKS